MRRLGLGNRLEHYFETPGAMYSIAIGCIPRSGDRSGGPHRSNGCGGEQPGTGRCACPPQHRLLWKPMRLVVPHIETNDRCPGDRRLHRSLRSGDRGTIRDDGLGHVVPGGGAGGGARTDFGRGKPTERVTVPVKENELVESVLSAASHPTRTASFVPATGLAHVARTKQGGSPTAPQAIAYRHARTHALAAQKTETSR